MNECDSKNVFAVNKIGNSKCWPDELPHQSAVRVSKTGDRPHFGVIRQHMTFDVKFWTVKRFLPCSLTFGVWGNSSCVRWDRQSPSALIVPNEELSPRHLAGLNKHHFCHSAIYVTFYSFHELLTSQLIWTNPPLLAHNPRCPLFTPSLTQGTTDGRDRHYRQVCKDLSTVTWKQNSQ